VPSPRTSAPANTSTPAPASLLNVTPRLKYVVPAPPREKAPLFVTTGVAPLPANPASALALNVPLLVKRAPSLARIQPVPVQAPVPLWVSRRSASPLSRAPSIVSVAPDSMSVSPVPRMSPPDQVHVFETARTPVPPRPPPVITKFAAGA